MTLWWRGRNAYPLCIPEADRCTRPEVLHWRPLSGRAAPPLLHIPKGRTDVRVTAVEMRSNASARADSFTQASLPADIGAGVTIPLFNVLRTRARTP